MREKKMTRTWVDVCIYLISFGLLWLWLEPLQALDAFQYYTPLLLFTGFTFVVTFLQLPILASLFIKGLAVVFMVDRLYFTAPLFSRSWRGFLREQVVINYQAVIDRHWAEITDVFQMVLLLVLMAIISYLIYFWVIVMRRAFVYTVLTLIYLTVMDTFTVFQANSTAYLLVFFVSLLLILNGYLKLQRRLGLPLKSSSFLLRLLVPFSIILIASLFISQSLPYLTPQWPDPVPFLTAPFEDGVERTVGYGEDDTQLGGGFNHDDTLLFEATISDPNYWRIESKDIYTGKGWEAQQPPDFMPMTPFDNNQAQFELNYFEAATFDKVVYPYYLTGVEESDTHQYEINIEQEVIRTVDTDPTEAVIQMNYDPFYFTEDHLRMGSREVPTEWRHLLQLPSSLPERVYQLADEITAGLSHPYDKAIAIERYFRTSGFQYRTTDIPVPELDEDYVDQFLFESKVGYCDNFSTAMVVLLRAAGVPARWTKGFTQGERVTDGREDVYQVRSDNAHSWVEVYFNNAGFVPFEPTIGFDASPLVTETTTEADDTDTDSATDDETTDEPSTNESEETSETEANNQQVEESEEEITTEEETAASQERDETRWRVIWLLSSVLLLTGLLLIVVYKQRLTLVLWYINKRYPTFNHVKQFEHAYQFLLFILAFKSIIKQRTETLLTFSARVDDYFKTAEMRRLTAAYTQVLYGEEKEIVAANHLKEDYLQLIKRILA